MPTKKELLEMERDLLLEDMEDVNAEIYDNIVEMEKLEEALQYED